MNTNGLQAMVCAHTKGEKWQEAFVILQQLCSGMMALNSIALTDVIGLCMRGKLCLPAVALLEDLCMRGKAPLC